MSGIAGIIHFDGAPANPELIKKMTAAMPYRGPDGINHWVRGSVALGQCMLRTTPESLEETQPWTNEDESLVLVMDGRVDNWEELRKVLLGRGVVLRNRSDAEVVLRSHELWGEECLDHIDGDFAFVAWDARNQKAFCARDRMGNKPFNYHWNGKTLVFASELKPILELPWVDEVINEGMLSEIISDEWHSRDETLWDGILRLVAAYQMRVEKQGVHLKKYWEPDYWQTIPFSKDEEYVDYYRELLTDTIRRLSRSHKPTSYEVSGGLDSSAVFCLAAQLCEEGELPAPGIRGYTLAFGDHSEANELAYVEAIREHLGRSIKEIAPSLVPLTWYSERARIIRDFPGYPNGAVHEAIAQEVHSTNGVVLLTGAGGDHWLQGSRVYYADELMLRHWKNLSDCFKADVQACGAGRAIKWFIRYGLFTRIPSTSKAMLRLLRHKLDKKLIRDANWLSPRMQKILEERKAAFYSDNERQLRDIGQQNMLRTLNYAFDHFAFELTERLAAESGVEVRHPMRTSKFVQYAFSTPERFRLRGNQQKYIHVKALQSVLPEIILKRGDKADFAFTFNVPINQMENEFTDVLPKNRADWLDRRGMKELFCSQKEHPELGWQNWVLWQIFVCDIVLPRNSDRNIWSGNE